MTHKALIKQLEDTCLGLDPIDPLRLLVDDVIEALRENAMREVQRLGQEIEQEPVAWRVKVETKLRDGSVDVGYQLRNEKMSAYDEPLYTHPPQRTWVGLTDDEIDTWNIVGHESLREFVRAIEAKLKEKNT